MHIPLARKMAALKALQRPENRGKDMKYPSEVYQISQKPYAGIQPLEYPMHDKTVNVTFCGRICIEKKKNNLSRVFAGHTLGLKKASEETWHVTFIDYDLG